jgi:hypothetical protein
MVFLLLRRACALSAFLMPLQAQRLKALKTISSMARLKTCRDTNRNLPLQNPVLSSQLSVLRKTARFDRDSKPSKQGIFHSLAVKSCRSPRGRAGERPPPMHQFWRDGTGHLGHVFPSRCLPIYISMGRKRYSRRLWLSRPNHYILYLNAINGVDAHLDPDYPQTRSWHPKWERWTARVPWGLMRRPPSEDSTR